MTRSLALFAIAISALLQLHTARADEATKVPPRYAVLSLIGENMEVIGYRWSIASNLNQNEHSAMPVPDAGFDATALRTAQEVIQAGEGKPQALLYAPTNHQLPEDPASLFHESKVELPADVAQAMQKDGASYALLITRRRHDADLQMRHGQTGSGHLEGVGYYVDQNKHMINQQTHFESRGFLAPYVSLQLSLIDVASGKIIAKREIYRSATLAAPGALETNNPWFILDESRKVARLNRMIEVEMKKAVPLLLKHDERPDDGDKSSS